METRFEETVAPDTGLNKDKVLAEIKAMLTRAEERAVEKAKAADRVIRDHPYQTIGLAFGVGLLIGVLAGRRK
jgi:ElaB/YqjD/DUF883 family membrane-anchored ribosome-binding protein